MRTFYAILLLGIVTYTAASKHRCDPYAANTVKKSGDEEGDQVIPLKEFVKRTQIVHFVTKATTSSVPGSSEFCTAATHGDKCEAVVYFREITKSPTEGSKNGAKDIEFNLTFLSVSGTTGKAILYEMKVVGDNEDDYIFKMAPNTEIKATEYSKEKGVAPKSVTVTKEVSEVLKSPFAVFYISENSGFSLYITCDGLSMWVSYDKVDVDRELTTEQLKEFGDQVERLKDIAFQEDTAEPDLDYVTAKIIPEFQPLIPEVTVA